MASGGPEKHSMIPPIRQWLQHVDKQLTREAVEFLKLGLYSEIEKDFKSLQIVSDATEIYNYLLEKRFQNDEQKALRMFAHVLLGLGRDLRGNHLVTDCLADYKIPKPKPLKESDMSKEFKLFQCLLKISTKARKLYLEDKLKVRFAKKKYLDMHDRNIPDLAYLFISLYQKNLIDWDFTRDLVYALKKYKAWQCLSYLNEYHKSVGLPPIKEVEDRAKGKGLPKSDSSTDPLAYNYYYGSSPPPTKAQERKIHNKKIRYNDDKVTTEDEMVIIRTSKTHRSRVCHGPVSISSESSSDSDEEVKTNSAEIREKQAANDQFNSDHSFAHRQAVLWWHPGVKIRNWCLVVKWIVLLLLSLVLLSLFFGFVWIHLLETPPHVTISAIEDDSTPFILQEFSTFYEKSVLVCHMNSTELNFYQFSQKCDSLQLGKSHPIEIALNNSTLSSSQQLYAMPGSTFEYKITILPKFKGIQSTTNIDLLNVTVLYKYKNPTQEVEILYHHSYNDIGEHSRPPFSVSERRQGYYWFEVDTHKQLVEYSFVMTATLEKISVQDTEKIDCNSQDHYEGCRVSFPFTFGPVCLVGEFSRSVKDGNWTYIELKSESSWVALAVTIPIVVTCFCLLFAVGCCVTCCCCFCKCCKNMFKFRSRVGKATLV